MFIVARGSAPKIENEANRFGQRPRSNPSTRIEYGRWPKKLRVFRIPGALPLAILKEAVGHKAKQRYFKTSKRVSEDLDAFSSLMRGVTKFSSNILSFQRHEGR